MAEATGLPPDRPGNLIAGVWLSAADVIPNINPSDTRDVVGEFPAAGAEDVAEAVNAAADAFPGWRATTSQQRADILDVAASEVRARRDELAQLLAREEGKTLPEAAGEVLRASQILRFFAGEAVRLQGQSGPSIRPNIHIDVSREPLGVVGLITPWNFPIAIPAWKLAPALAFGNCVVLKPSEWAPASAWALVEILHRAGLPPGVLNLVCGHGHSVGRALSESARVNAVSFTGSVATGAAVAAACAQRQCALQLEMGGKNPLVVLDDADLKIAIDCAVNGAFFSTGQRCTASSRLIVTRGIYPRFLEGLLQRLSSLRVDHALKAGTDIGPLVNQMQLEKSERYLEIARREGATVASGGERLQRDTPGYYLAPALLTETTSAMTVNREEIFGPVASVIRVDSYEEALQVANDTQAGLCAGICTTNHHHAAHFRQHAETGLVMVNLPTAGLDYHVPFGGRKGSSFGPREQGGAARDFYTTTKTAYIAT